MYNRYSGKGNNKEKGCEEKAMRKETKTVVYDGELRLEAYRFEGRKQPFPNHFHEYYVLGFVEGGRRVLSCKNQEYVIEKGDIILFHPGDNHDCVQIDEESFDYRAFHISKETMGGLAEEITGKRELPGFSQNVIRDEEAAEYMGFLHQMVMEKSGGLLKEEALLLLLSMLMEKYGQPFKICVPRHPEEIEKACAYMEEHSAERIYLEQICRYAGLSKSTLLRAFTKAKGITPYRYLETIRINEAKKLLKKGVAPSAAAVETGFSDQSHFTNSFNSIIGLSPGMYRQIFFQKNKDEKNNEA